MNTAKIKPGQIYALQRSDGLVRFHCTAIVTRKEESGPAKNSILGWVAEDRAEGSRPQEVKIDPELLVGPYEEQATLVERRKQEEADVQTHKMAKQKQAKIDRLALYAFVGEAAPVDVTAWNQLFRIDSGSSIDISRDGTQAIIAAVAKLPGLGKSLRVVK